MFDRSTGSRIAVSGDDATVVGPTAQSRTRATRRRDFVIGALLLAVASGVALAGRVFTQPATSVLVQPRALPMPIVIPLPPQAVPLETPETLPSAVRGDSLENTAPNKAAKARSRLRRHVPMVRAGAPVAEGVVEHPVEPRPVSMDVFDRPLHAGKHAPAQAIDREDPYGQ